MTQENPSFSALYRALDFERPLDISKPDDEKLYVQDLHTSNGYDPIADLRASIEITDKPGTWLFTGQRGVGKSTELHCMAHRLRQCGFTVWVVDILDYINPADPANIESLLLSIGAALADEAERKGLRTETMNQGPVARLWDLLKNTTPSLPEINSQLALAPGVSTSIKLKLEHHPGLRQLILNSVRSAPVTLAEQVRTLAKEVAKASQTTAHPTLPPVLIVDSLEKLRISGTRSQECYDAIINTFDLHGEYLKLQHLHVVYSVPPYLPFLCPGIGSYFGVEICTLPHVKVFASPSPAKPDQTIPDTVNVYEPGVAMLIDCLTHRYPHAKQLIPPEQIRDLAVSSSGSVRDFFRLLRSVCTKAHAARSPTPLATDHWLDLAKQALRNEMPLTIEDKQWLRKVRISHGAELAAMDKLHQLARLFDNGLILNYRNGTNWCEAQYLLHDALNTD